MKHLPDLLVLGCGFAVGCLLPSAITGWHCKDTGAAHASARHEQERETRKKELLDALLDPQDRERHKVESATSLVELLSVLHETSSYGDIEVERIVDMDSAAALNQWLADPSASGQMCGLIAVKWGCRNPEQAIGFLRQKHSYRAVDCLDKVLLAVKSIHPQLVGEVVRSKSREWQEKHLEELFTGTYRIRKPGAPPEPVSQDPFAECDDGYWITKKNGEDFLNDLADDGLRKKAMSFWIDKTPEPPPPDKPKPALDVANFDGDDSSQYGALREQLDKSPKQTLALLAARGGFEVRSKAIMMAEFSMDQKSWPTALNELEATMQQLGVIPEYPPSHFEMGAFLRGEAAARWVSRQPLGLQRAWASTFTETWAGTEPDAAINWARSLPVDANRDAAAQSGVIVWAHEKPLEAAAYVESLPAGDMRESSISNAAAAWSCVDRAGAKKWLATLPDSCGKARGLERVK